MEEENSKRLKAERTQIRRVFTLSINKLKSLLHDDNSDIKEINIEFTKAADRAERLFKLDEQIKEIIFLHETDEVITEEFDKVEEYRDQWLEIVVLKDNFVNIEDENVSSKASSISSKSNKRKKYLKLIKLQPHKFDGDIKNWITFWSIFSKIHEDTEMEDDIKFQYLLQYTLEKSPARTLLESFPPTKENYPKAIEQLKNRFGRKELLLELYIRELLKLVLAHNSGERKLKLCELYDKLETQIRALDSLGYNVDQFAFMLIPLVESALPEPVLKDWERHRVFHKLNIVDNCADYAKQMEQLLCFLKSEVESEERINLKKDNFGFEDKKETPIKSKKEVSMKKEKIPTATDLINVKGGEQSRCLFCNGKHSSELCFKALDMSPEEINKTLREKGCCFVCLRKGHNTQKCRAFLRCVICDGKHTILKCPDRKKKTESQDKVNVGANLTNNTCTGVILLQTLYVKVRNGDISCSARAIVDTGSQRSYITKKLVHLLKFKSVGEEKIIHALFGGVNSSPFSHKNYKIQIGDINSENYYNFDVLDSEQICQHIPKAVDGSWVADLEKKGITLSDKEEGPIDILIGADVAGKLMTGTKVILNNGLVALETLLGWTLIGRVKDTESSYMVNINLLCNDVNVSDLWRLDVLGIEDPHQVQTRAETALAARKYFLQTVRIQKGGRYEVRLPWLEGHPPLPRNFDIAKKRLDSTLRKLKSSGTETEYDDIFRFWLNEGIIEEVAVEDWDKGHYMPHRPVYKESSLTTRIRPVFDASSKEKDKPSLNFCLEKGLNLVELIPSLLMRFRANEIGVISDMEKAFLQISICEDDRDVLRFLWIDLSNGQLKIFRHTRVVFGVTSSPFLLGSVIEHHLQLCEKRAEEHEQPYSVKTIARLRNSFYVDNCVTSLSSQQEVETFVEEATSLFAEACFRLRGWEFSYSTTEEQSETAVLGLIWNKQSDTLKINSPDWTNVEKEEVTRRTILSTTQRIFDPVGFTAPTTLTPKLMIQLTWKEGGSWDSPVAEDIKNNYLQWVSEAPLLKIIEIPRWMMAGNSNHQSIWLHVFCDASTVAYGTVIFLRIEAEDGVQVFFVQARTRVAPLKTTTVPRLELLAALMGARLCHSIIKEFPTVEIQYWSDSSTTLCWIKREEPWGIFVWNRVTEIRNLTDKDSWRHIPGSQNPADYLTRGCSPNSLCNSRWWEGPSWLKWDPSQWPASDFSTNEEEIMSEKKKGVVTGIVCKKEDSFRDLLLSNIQNRSYLFLLRKLCWILRFISNGRLKPENRRRGDVTVVELEKAEVIVLKMVQEQSFSGVEDKSLRKLKPHLDKQHLIRLRTKVWARKDAEGFRSPIILPSKHPMVELIILDIHKKNGHILGQGLLNALRENYWIIRARQVVRRVTMRCGVCRRFQAKPLDVETPPLPAERVRDANIFEIIGCDLAGPLYLRDGNKVWIAIFTCAVYRAVHLDLVSSLSTAAFMMAFRRFVARRGRPSIVFCDNGTNFRGMSNAINGLDWSKIATYSAAQRIQWRFNPPGAAWWGGFYERLIGMLKSLLRRNLGKASLNQEELYTLVSECETLMNNRPLTYISEDNQDPIPLTPLMFLQDLRSTGVPECDVIDSESLNHRYRYRQRIKEELKKRFRIEYLGQLQYGNRRNKNTREPMKGEVVLVASDNKKRIDWPMAVVENLIRGSDGKCRVVHLKTSEGHLSRPVQRVYPLELLPTDTTDCDTRLNEHREAAEEDTTKPKEKIVHRVMHTRCGRKINIPIKYRD